MLVPTTTLLIVALVEVAEIEASGHVEAAIWSATDLLILLLVVAVYGADAAAAAAPGSRRLRIDLLVMPIATRIRFRATRRSVALGVQEIVLLEGRVSCHSRVCAYRMIVILVSAATLYHNL